MPSVVFRRDHLRFTSGIICGSGSFAGQFGDHFRSGDHLRSGIICGAVQNSQSNWVMRAKIGKLTVVLWLIVVYLAVQLWIMFVYDKEKGRPRDKKWDLLQQCLRGPNKFVFFPIFLFLSSVMSVAVFREYAWKFGWATSMMNLSTNSNAELERHKW